jgi:hypothetical protein
MARPSVRLAIGTEAPGSEGEDHTFKSCRVRHLHQSTLSQFTDCLSTLPRSHSDLQIRRIHTNVDVDPEADINGCGFTPIQYELRHSVAAPAA